MKKFYGMLHTVATEKGLIETHVYDTKPEGGYILSGYVVVDGNTHEVIRGQNGPFRVVGRQTERVYREVDTDGLAERVK